MIMLSNDDIKYAKLNYYQCTSLHRISRLNVLGFNETKTHLEDLKGRTRSKGDRVNRPNTLR